MLSFPFQTSVLISLCFPFPRVHFCFSSARVHFWTWSYLGLWLPLLMTHHFLSPALDFPVYTRLLQPPSYISAWISNRHCRINSLKIHLFLQLPWKLVYPCPSQIYHFYYFSISFFKAISTSNTPAVLLAHVVKYPSIFPNFSCYHPNSDISYIAWMKALVSPTFTFLSHSFPHNRQMALKYKSDYIILHCWTNKWI